MNNVRCIDISDIHFGHRYTSTQSIISGFNKWTDDNISIIKTIDIFFISGDVFDKLLHYKSPDVLDISYWFISILKICQHFDIMLRVLEGTSSHDWGQSANFGALASRFDVSFRYINSLTIEHIDEFNIDILYVPDEWRTTCEETKRDVISLLSEKHLRSVDLAIMHGNFKHQLPPIQGIDHHDNTFYTSIVSGYVVIGHIHKHSVLDNILAPGSFDRIAHGEEESKGGIYFELSNNGKSFKFMENPYASVYKTIRISPKNDIQKAMSIIDKRLSNIAGGSHVKIVTGATSPILGHFRFLKDRYPLLRLTKDTTDKKQRNKEVTTLKYKSVVIVKDNFEDVFSTYVSDNFNESKGVIIETLKKYL